MKEIRSLEEGLTESGCTRLCEEVADLEGELKKQEAFMFSLAEQNDWLQSELTDTKEKLAAEEASVDELLEFKSSTCLEAQRRLMCPRE